MAYKLSYKPPTLHHEQMISREELNASTVYIMASIMASNVVHEWLIISHPLIILEAIMHFSMVLLVCGIAGVAGLWHAMQAKSMCI